MSSKELTKDELKKKLSYEDLMRLGGSLVVKHLADSLEKEEENENN